MSLLGQSTGETQGRLVAALLAGSWRSEVSAPELAEADLALGASLLFKSGGAALGWWRIRDSRLAQTEAAQTLHHAYRLQRLYAAIHEREIKYIFSLLRNAGIEPVLVKGWANARHYPDRGLRPYGDIDLCVRPDQFTKAAAVLKCLDDLDGHCVDLHDGFTKLNGGKQVFRVPASAGSLSERKRNRPTEVGLNTCWDELFDRSHLVDLGEEKIRVLSPEDHLRVICLHLLRSDACRPLWLCDVAVALESMTPDFDWQVCFGGNDVHADWITKTIALAQQLLDAEVAKLGARGKAQSAKWKLRNPQFAIRNPKSEIPSWLVPAVLRQWGRAPNQHRDGMAVPKLWAAIKRPSEFSREVYARWDRPIRATMRLQKQFTNTTPFPFQMADWFYRSRVLPGQMAKMIFG